MENESDNRPHGPHGKTCDCGVEVSQENVSAFVKKLAELMSSSEAKKLPISQMACIILGTGLSMYKTIGGFSSPRLIADIAHDLDDHDSGACSLPGVTIHLEAHNVQ